MFLSISGQRMSDIRVQIDKTTIKITKTQEAAEGRKVLRRFPFPNGFDPIVAHVYTMAVDLVAEKLYFV